MKYLLISLTLSWKIITLAHQAHLGIVKAKQLLRSKCFRLGMDSRYFKMFTTSSSSERINSTTNKRLQNYQNNPGNI